MIVPKVHLIDYRCPGQTAILPPPHKSWGAWCSASFHPIFAIIIHTFAIPPDCRRLPLRPPRNATDCIESRVKCWCHIFILLTWCYGMLLVNCIVFLCIAMASSLFCSVCTTADRCSIPVIWSQCFLALLWEREDHEEERFHWPWKLWGVARSARKQVLPVFVLVENTWSWQHQDVLHGCRYWCWDGGMG